jgi:hypothetical protein
MQILKQKNLELNLGPPPKTQLLRRSQNLKHVHNNPYNKPQETVFTYESPKA